MDIGIQFCDLVVVMFRTTCGNYLVALEREEVLVNL